jgi:hypothetical protein
MPKIFEYFGFYFFFIQMNMNRFTYMLSVEITNWYMRLSLKTVILYLLLGEM